MAVSRVLPDGLVKTKFIFICVLAEKIPFLWWEQGRRKKVSMAHHCDVDRGGRIVVGIGEKKCDSKNIFMYLFVFN